ncbi:MAG: 2,3-bisphosphoglycerate-dependent phosphoglycerate mutase [Chlamydiota bacterium]|jgi:2,3-bisphosphoglycerate-dependent phosphoglycerate mutase
MGKLILLRHGESTWNHLNVFTGWVDIPLSRRGMEESTLAGKQIADLPIDLIFTSSLIRAQTTVTIAMLEHSSQKSPRFMHPSDPSFHGWDAIHSNIEEQTIPVYIAWQLNERMYGELQGKNKQEMREKFGSEQVEKWRRSFDAAPPQGESLKQTAERALPYFKERILPLLFAGKNVLVAAHGNSLRAVVMFLDNLSSQEIVHKEIATGKPIIYTFTNSSWAQNG